MSFVETVLQVYSSKASIFIFKSKSLKGIAGMTHHNLSI